MNNVGLEGSSEIGQTLPTGGQETAESTATVVIADDHAVVRSALRLLLEREPDLHVVAEAGDVPATIDVVGEHKPSVLILDLNMPGGPSHAAIPQLRQSSPKTAIVVLTMQNDPEFARQALREGVLGYILKEAADTELVKAVRAATGGDMYLQPALGARLAAESDSPFGNLTGREVEVLRLIALGYTNAEIAGELDISVRTVETHRAHIQQKLGIAKRTEMVRYALDRGLLAS